MNAHQLLAGLEPVVLSSPLWQGKHIKIIIIANPGAGGFTHKHRSEDHENALRCAADAARSKPVLCASFSSAVYYTEYAGHAAKLAGDAASEAQTSDKDFLLVSAGGDGTALEIQSALARLVFGDNSLSVSGISRIIRERITVLRLPFGTGNDGSDGRTLKESLERLAGSGRCVLQRALRVYFTGNADKADSAGSGKRVHYDSLESSPPWYAFNIASIGIDAFIAHMTNHTKGVLPGNFYKLWIDLACLFYEMRFAVSKAKISAFDSQGGIIKMLEEPFLFCLMGVSGKRTYGSNQKILPDGNNVCVARKLRLLQKLLLKEKFKSGKHAGDPAAVLLTAEKLVIEYDKDILAQLDGEIHYVRASQFPLVFERTEPVVRILAPAMKPATRCSSAALIPQPS